MSKDEMFYQHITRARTLSNMMANSKLPSSKDKGCRHSPLLNFEPSDIVLDELHLLLRITDRLTKNLLAECQEMDHRAGQRRGVGQKVKEVCGAVRECGVSFDAYLEKNDNGQETSKLKFTSLTGDAKKKLMQQLPDKLRGILNDDTVEDVIQLWKVRQ